MTKISILLFVNVSKAVNGSLFIGSLIFNEVFKSTGIFVIFSNFLTIDISWNFETDLQFGLWMYHQHES